MINLCNFKKRKQIAFIMNRLCSIGSVISIGYFFIDVMKKLFNVCVIHIIVIYVTDGRCCYERKMKKVYDCLKISPFLNEMQNVKCLSS